jgi:hypothetical protein
MASLSGHGCLRAPGWGIGVKVNSEVQRALALQLANIGTVYCRDFKEWVQGQQAAPIAQAIGDKKQETKGWAR